VRCRNVSGGEGKRQLRDRRMAFGPMQEEGSYWTTNFFFTAAEEAETPN